MILLIALTLLSVIYGQMYMCFVFSGLLMILLTARSFMDKNSILVNLMLIISCVGFAAFSNNFASFLIFYEVDLKKHRYINLFLPPFCYLIYSLIISKSDVPNILLRIIILVLLSVLIFSVRKIISNYSSANTQKERSLKITAVNELYQKKLNHELEFENYLTDKNARYEERENISRSIHNCVGHSITAAIITLDAADMLFDVSPLKAREKMNAANERMRTSLDSVRQAVRLLNTDDMFISMYDFTESIKNISGSFDMDTGTNTAIDSELSEISLQIPRDHAEFLTGTVQEMLSNGVRHGKADRFNIIISSDSGHIMLVITDNGSGGYSVENSKEKIHNGFGLKRLISYTKRCGGNISFSNNNGFRTEIVLPLRKPDENE